MDDLVIGCKIAQYGLHTSRNKRPKQMSKTVKRVRCKVKGLLGCREKMREESCAIPGYLFSRKDQ